jgi:hypothetical protein
VGAIIDDLSGIPHSRYPTLNDTGSAFGASSERLEGARSCNAYGTAIVAELPTAPPAHSKADTLLSALSLLHPAPGENFKTDALRYCTLAAACNAAELGFQLREARSAVSRWAGASRVAARRMTQGRDRPYVSLDRGYTLRSE